MFYLGYGRRVKSLEDPLCVEHDKVEECKYFSLFFVGAFLTFTIDIERYVVTNALSCELTVIEPLSLVPSKSLET